MIRFPNPGSNVESFVQVFSAALNCYEDKVVNLDDLVAATIESNLVTSSGFIGKKAIERSTRPDRSRDPLYNQMKMYAELFRTLGWLMSSSDLALKYTFTQLGKQLVEARTHYVPLLEECLLGISYPNRALQVKSPQIVRPFSAILRAMLICDGGLSRDEMIIGPLNIESDRNPAQIEAMASKIMPLRYSKQRIERSLQEISEMKNVQVNTLKNYTRWPIGVLRDLGWTEKRKEAFADGIESFEIHRLTARGREKAQDVLESTDIRADEVGQLPLEQKRAVSRHAYYEMIERAGFDVSSVRQERNEMEGALELACGALKVRRTARLLFSPFQSLSPAEIEEIFPSPLTPSSTNDQAVSEGFQNVREKLRAKMFVRPMFVHRKNVEGDAAGSEGIKKELADLLACSDREESAVRTFLDRRANTNKDVFYPLIENIFNLLAVECRCSRAGVNYQRWDACLQVDGYAIPIEIKSPAEEEFLSIKAVRQAVENKVILLARNELPTMRGHTTLIVGYKLPNERGDMAELISDIFTSFQIRVGVISLQTLVQLLVRAIQDSSVVDKHQLVHLKGFLAV